MEFRLTAILISDIVSYTKLMEEDTRGTVAAWSDVRDNVIEPKIESSSGRLVKFMGDGFLAEFNTVQMALECAIEIQNSVKNNSLKFRMAVHMGDIIDDGKDIYGEGINIASRLEGVAEPGGICISGDVYNQVRNRISAEYEDIGPQEVKNVAEPVHAYNVRFEKMAERREKRSEGRRAERPCIAVLPFDNMSGDPEQEYFSDGITEDIITALSHLRWLDVIARNSSFTYKGQSQDIRKVSEELNCRYVLEGSIQRAGNRIRINAQLLEGASGNHLWADKFDKELEDVFDLQDKITSSVVLQIRPELERIEFKRVQEKTPEAMCAWDLFQKGKWTIYSRPQGIVEGVKWLELAEEADNSYIDATALRVSIQASANLLFNRSYDLTEDFKKLERTKIQDPDNDLIQTGMGVYQNYSLGSPLVALPFFESAIRLNPTNMIAQRYYLQCLIFLNRAEDALSHYDKIGEISPKDPEMMRFDARCAEAHLGLKNFMEAKKYGMISTSHPITLWPSYAALISALGHLGELDEAVTVLENLKSRMISMPEVDCNPEEILSLKYIENALPFHGNEYKEIYLSGLRKAHFPE